MPAYADAAASVQQLDAVAAQSADLLQARLTKPAGALGRLETLGTQLAAIARQVPPPVPRRPVAVVFAGDHGVLAEGVSPWPAEVTAQMVANFVAGGAAINVLSRQVGADVVVVDIGVGTPIPSTGAAVEGRLIRANVRAGTGNIAREPAMTRDEAEMALDVGARLAAELVDAGADCLLTGDMGIGNTTPSASLIAVFTRRPARDVTGRGTGITDEQLQQKVAVVERAVARAGVEEADAVGVLAELGGMEIAGLAGLVIGGAAAGVPVIIDGVIALAATLVASSIAPRVLGYCIAGHLSTEPGAGAALEHLGLEPVLDLGLRLGEGSGACLAVPMVQAAARILAEMATFDSAGVSEREAGVSEREDGDAS